MGGTGHCSDLLDSHALNFRYQDQDGYTGKIKYDLTVAVNCRSPEYHFHTKDDGPSWASKLTVQLSASINVAVSSNKTVRETLGRGTFQTSREWVDKHIITKHSVFKR
ncbi:hypothetical protein D5018_00645 [Parashewanella curva]|uniref:Uncharacterized protein n=1 Tax=Parashewanella curva TaxID=2338552 RepID=A0A3L8Q399_9GAMM|nr:hypothetical protein [Parashewanella curva]RLV61659.1 hypothetical protein D5018_00645 [Parashewanella curva]